MRGNSNVKYARRIYVMILNKEIFMSWTLKLVVWNLYSIFLHIGREENERIPGQGSNDASQNTHKMLLK